MRIYVNGNDDNDARGFVQQHHVQKARCVVKSSLPYFVHICMYIQRLLSIHVQICVQKNQRRCAIRAGSNGRRTCVVFVLWRGADVRNYASLLSSPNGFMEFLREDDARMTLVVIE